MKSNGGEKVHNNKGLGTVEVILILIVLIIIVLVFRDKLMELATFLISKRMEVK